MSIPSLVAPCGLNCDLCPVFQAGSNPDLAKIIAERNGITMEEAVCQGCRAEKGCIKVNGIEICHTFDCVNNQKKLDFCFDCEDFPCDKLAPCADRAKEIPHNTKIYNLLSIRKQGVDKWLQQSPVISKNYYRGKKPRGGDEIQI